MKNVIPSSHVAEVKRNTPEYFKRRTWKNLNIVTVNGGSPQTKQKTVRDGIKLKFNKSEFDSYIDTMEPLIKALYRAGEQPILKRINPSKHYTISNVMIVPGSIRAPIIPVHQQTLTRKIKNAIQGFFRALVAEVRSGIAFQRKS